MKYKRFKKITAVNRGTVITMLVLLGVSVLELLAISVAAIFATDKGGVAAVFIAVPVTSMVVFPWALLLCSLGIFTTGYAEAIGAGMTRKDYLGGAYLTALAFTCASLIPSLLSALLASFISAPDALPNKWDNIAFIMLSLCVGQLLLLLLTLAIGILFSAILLRFGMKTLPYVFFLISALFLFAPKGIELFESLPQASLPAVLGIAALAAASFIAGLTALGRRLVYRQNI